MKRLPAGPEFDLLSLSPASRYALSAVSHLALQPAGSYSRIDKIAAGRGLPKSFLAKILRRLAERGLIVSRRGPGGGHALARPAGELSLGDVIGAVEDARDGERRCVLELHPCGPGQHCALHDQVFQSEMTVWSLLARTKLEQYARGRRSGQRSVTR